METLNDVGAAEFLSVNTLTATVYSTWVNRGDLPGAAQIALAMLLFVGLVLLLERTARGNRGYAVIGIAVVAMLITPGDGLSMLLMMVPMYLLYEAGIIAAGLAMPRPDDARA